MATPLAPRRRTVLPAIASSDAAILERFAALETRVAACERWQLACSVRDAADAAVVPGLARAFGSARFNAKATIARARIDPDLAHVLANADITTPRELGWLLRRVQGRDFAGFTVAIVHTSSKGHWWRVSVSSE